MKNNEKSVYSHEFLQATEDFNKARNKAILAGIQNIGNSKNDELLSFYDVKEILKPQNQVYMGMKQVPIKLIVGSEGRYRDFNKYFLPRSEFLRSRWERVDRAQLTDVALPAIQLYEIGGAYFVRDGNHRVSVARSQGVEEIDAEVTSLGSEITITAGMTTDDLRRAVIELEKKIFYEKTDFGTLTGDNNLIFTTPGRYDKIYTHIMDHKYFLNQDKPDEIPMSRALVSWYGNIYQPIVKIIINDRLGPNFPGNSASDLYLMIVRHWDFMKRKKGADYSLIAAARNFSHRYGNRPSLFSRFAEVLRKIFKSRISFA